MASDEPRLDLDNLFGDLGDMTTNESSSPREVWVKPEVVSYEPISATAAATFNPGDGLSSNS